MRLLSPHVSSQSLLCLLKRFGLLSQRAKGTQGERMLGLLLAGIGCPWSTYWLELPMSQRELESPIPPICTSYIELEIELEIWVIPVVILTRKRCQKSGYQIAHFCMVDRLLRLVESFSLPVLLPSWDLSTDSAYMLPRCVCKRAGMVRNSCCALCKW